MSKSLFDKDARYTPEASRLDEAAGAVIDSFFDSHVRAGYSPREIGALLYATVSDSMCKAVLDLHKLHKLPEGETDG
jgi:hypothetical protein